MKRILTLLLSTMLLWFIMSTAHAELVETPIDWTWEVITTSISENLTWELVTTKAVNEIIGSKSYLYYYGTGCSHCAKVDAYLKWVGAYDVLDIVKKDTWDQSKPENNENMLKDAERLWISVSNIWVPFLIITENGKETFLTGDQSIINYFTPILWEAPEKDGTIVLIILWLLVVIISGGIIYWGKNK